MNKAKTGKHTLFEILNQAAAWEETIKLVEAEAAKLMELFAGVDQVIFTGCGSALNVSYAFESSYLYEVGNPNPISTSPSAELLANYSTSDNFYLDNQRGTISIGDDGIENDYQSRSNLDEVIDINKKLKYQQIGACCYRSKSDMKVIL